MATIWQESVQRGLDEALDLLGTVVSDCPDHLWRVSMWPVLTSDIAGDVHDDHGNTIFDESRREARVQRWSQPWSVAWHTLEVFDYDLTGELDTWTPPAPFLGKPHWRTFTYLPAWSRSEITDYVEYCRQRSRDMLGGDLTDEKARTLLPEKHRYRGKAYAWLVTSLIGHTTAHAMQIRQFIDGGGPF